MNTKLNSITILGGIDKNSKEENMKLTLYPGDITCIVGPTGSGKSRFLGDIECLAQKDTPTKRQVLVNTMAPKDNMRFSIENKLVAQLSQNMNFVMDLTVKEFITMHAESKNNKNINSKVSKIISCANNLAGETFSPNTPLTELSGGQSRALMIADTAILSLCPIVLIDEIENAGIDKKKALELLVKNNKIVFISTHDATLALMGNRRIIFKNGGVEKIIETSPKEKENLIELEKIDSKMFQIRDKLRNGENLDINLCEYFEAKQN